MNSSERILAATVLSVRASSASASLDTASIATSRERAFRASPLSFFSSSEGAASLTRPVDGGPVDGGHGVLLTVSRTSRQAPIMGARPGAG
jgi:hypothetical protein